MGAYLLWDGDALHFDAVLNESVTITATPTRHSVEEGAAITDHVQDDPDRVRLDVFVSGSPIADVNGVGVVTQVTDTGAGFSASVLRTPANFDPVRNTMRTLERLKKEATLVDVATHARYCASMVITEASSSPKGDSSQIQITLESIRVVSTGRTQAPQPTQPRDKPAKTTGAQQPKPTPGPKKSAAVAVGQWTGLLSA